LAAVAAAHLAAVAAAGLAVAAVAFCGLLLWDEDPSVSLFFLSPIFKGPCREERAVSLLITVNFTVKIFPNTDPDPT
jgi:hypothetical protein